MENNGEIKILSSLFNNYYGFPPKNIDVLAGAGSGRRYYRLRNKEVSCIGVGGENIRDCQGFINLANVFSRCGVNVPEIFAVSPDGLCYIESDLGEVSLFDLIRNRDYNDAIVRKSLEELARMQSIPESVWSDSVEYGEFSRRQIFWDLNYFKYEFVKPGGYEFDEELLENDFEKLADSLIGFAREESGFMFRDFQSRNIMICHNQPWFIDFQGGRKGPVVYDAISFLWQARAGFPHEYRAKMMDYYIDCLCGNDKVRKDNIKGSIPLFVLFRTLQVLGAYGLRGLIEKKAHFIESIPAALETLSGLMDSGVVDSYPELKRLSTEMVKDPRFVMRMEGGELTVTVFSFSYKKGYPDDYSGNGGGFMFDCRGMSNPGRFEVYKKLTGRDLPVIKFLEEKGEVKEFCRKSFDIVSPSVDRYLKRGFSSLQIGFGCTGGQHRSVYCADRIAKLIAQRYPEARVILIHREQGIRECII